VNHATVLPTDSDDPRPADPTGPAAAHQKVSGNPRVDAAISPTPKVSLVGYKTLKQTGLKIKET
jgi:hypothetical protein